MLFPFLPTPLIHLHRGIEINPKSILKSVFVFTVILPTIKPFINSLSMHFIIFSFTLVLLLIFPCNFSFTIKHLILKIPHINTSIILLQNPMPIKFIIFILPIINSSICKIFLSQSIFLTFTKISHKRTSLKIGYFIFSMGLVIFKISLAHISTLHDDSALSTIFIITKLSYI